MSVYPEIPPSLRRIFQTPGKNGFMPTLHHFTNQIPLALLSVFLTA